MSEDPKGAYDYFPSFYDERYSAARIVNNKTFAFMFQDYWFGGGTHGMETSTYKNYDLQIGNQITLDILFSEKSKTIIPELLKQKIDTTILISALYLFETVANICQPINLNKEKSKNKVKSVYSEDFALLKAVKNILLPAM